LQQPVQLLRYGSKTHQPAEEIPHHDLMSAEFVQCQDGWRARERLMRQTGASTMVLLLLNRQRAGMHAQEWVAWLERAGAAVTTLNINDPSTSAPAGIAPPNTAVIVMTRGVPRAVLDACLSATSTTPPVLRLGPRLRPPWRLLDEHAGDGTLPAVGLRLMLVAAGLVPIRAVPTRNG